MMTKKINQTEAIFLGIAGFVLIAEVLATELSWFALFSIGWNILPVMLYYFLFKNGIPFRDKRLVKITLGITGFLMLFLPLYSHLDWVMSSHGSTEGLAFIFIPLWGILFSIIPAVVQLVYVQRLKTGGQ